MSQCTKCGTALQKNAKFCSNCGAKVEAPVAALCLHCGNQLKPDARFCNHCGQPVASAPESSLAPAVTEGWEGESIEQEQQKPSRSWKTTLLPLIGIPVLFGIIFLLTYSNQKPKPISESAGSTQSQADGSGMPMAGMEEVTKQIEKYKSDLQANPKDTTALLALGSMYEIASFFSEATDYYKRYLEIVPDNVQVRMSLAGVYYNDAKKDLALKELQQVLKYEPDYEYAMYNLGVIHFSEGKKDEAIKWWHKVIEANPSSELAANASRQIKAATGQ